MRKLRILIMIFLLSGCSLGTNEEKEITISAAASLKDAVEEIGHEYEKEHPDVQIYYNFGSTGTLKQQLIQGAPTDLFLSAAKIDFDELVKRKLLNEKYASDLLGNSLVLIGTDEVKQSVTSLGDLQNESFSKIAIGTPENVPAGQYAMEALQSENIWDELEHKFVYGKDVRQVLTYVESNNVTAGIVYKTDAYISDKVNVLYEIPEDFHAPLIYSVGVVKRTNHKEEAASIFEFMKSDKAIAIFEKYGFKGLNE